MAYLFKKLELACAVVANKLRLRKSVMQFQKQRTRNLCFFFFSFSFSSGTCIEKYIFILKISLGPTQTLVMEYSTLFVCTKWLIRDPFLPLYPYRAFTKSSFADQKTY